LQACHQITLNGSIGEHPNSASNPRFGITLSMPFLLVGLPGSDSEQAATFAVQQASKMPGLSGALSAASEPEVAFCSFEVSLTAPPRFEVRGWQSAADAPEDLPDSIKSSSVSLLACLDGQFVAVEVEQLSVINEGERLLQVG